MPDRMANVWALQAQIAAGLTPRLGPFTRSYTAVVEAIAVLWGLLAMQAAPDRALSLASQLPPRPLQPVDVGMAAQAACGSGLARDAGGA